jgi:TonB family protein
MRNIILALAILITVFCYSQSNPITDATRDNKSSRQSPAKENSETEFLCIETMPVFPGGEKALVNYINRTVSYPKRAIDNCIEGRVVVRFVVREDGSVDQASVLKSAGPDLDNELLRVVRSLPRFKPGLIGDKPVPVWYMVPCLFILEGETPPVNKIVSRPPETHTDRVKITLFPNPASDYLTIVADTIAKDMEVSLVSSTGQVILQQELRTEETRLSLEGIFPGLIIVTIKSPSTGFAKSFKVIKGPV